MSAQGRIQSREEGFSAPTFHFHEQFDTSGNSENFSLNIHTLTLDRILIFNKSILLPVNMCKIAG